MHNVRSSYYYTSRIVCNLQIIITGEVYEMLLGYIFQLDIYF